MNLYQVTYLFYVLPGGIIVETPQLGPVVGHHRVVVIDSLYASQADGCAFYPPGEPHKLVGFDVANYNSQVRLDEVPVDPHRRVPLGLAQVHQAVRDIGIMAKNRITF